MDDQTIVNRDGVIQSPFERIKRVDDEGNVFWSARELMTVLNYSSWQKFAKVLYEIYSSFYMDNPLQKVIIPTIIKVQIGSGAWRDIQDWRIKRPALNRLLGRVVAYKPKEVWQNKISFTGRFRIESKIGSLLTNFCNQVNLPIVTQKHLDKFIFDFCIADKLLIEVDEIHHRDKYNRSNDAAKDTVALNKGFHLLRIKIPVYDIIHVWEIAMQLINMAEPMLITYSASEGLKGNLMLTNMKNPDLATHLFCLTQALGVIEREQAVSMTEVEQVCDRVVEVVKNTITELGNVVPYNLSVTALVKSSLWYVNNSQ